MAQPNPGGQPPTFKSNVNRAKTKKWIEAKSYSYDGDDWGEVDDYDEYGGYEDPPDLPPPAPRNTGLRQRGQSASQPAELGGPSVQQSPYGGLGHSQPQQSQAERSFTQPSQPSAVQRQNSFDPDQERRAFSSGPPPLSGQNRAPGPYGIPTPHNQPAARDFQPSQTRLNQTGPPYNASYAGQASAQTGPYRGPPSPQRPLMPHAESRDSSMASNDSLDFHNRRDFSPSAMPNPLQPRGSPSPNQGGGRPPRSSSLTQDNAPEIPFPVQMPASQRERASSSQSNKGLPFVRPADIYRRMEEEKERVRRSQESSRPSMDTITGRPRQESEVTGRPRQISNLNPVHERKQSELAMEGLGTSAGTGEDTQSTEKGPTTSKRFEIKKPSGSTSPSGAPSLGPILPDVGRISSFGDSFGESFMNSSGTLGSLSAPTNPDLSLTRDPEVRKPQQQSTTLPPSQSAQSADLQHQRSLGFTSAVHHSFDAAQEDVPPTPSSVTNSSIERSASGGTSVVSPIMSRGPSTANEPWNNTLPAIEDVTSSVQPRQLQANQRPAPEARRPSPSQPAPEQSLNPQPSPPFVTGHRRNMSTPSPDNSPARTPALDATRHLRTPQEVELAETTPTPTESEVSADDQLMRGRQTMDQYPTPDQLALSEGRSRTTAEQAQRLQQSAPKDLPSVPPTSFARERPDSAGSGRIRDMAEKFGGSGSRPQSSHSNTTPRASMVPSNAPGPEDLMPPRPITDRIESFRPHLPGGWESSASIAPAAVGSQTASPAQFQRDSGSVPTTPTPKHPDGQKEAPTTVQQVKDASQDAFAAAASAGGALAASLASVAGIKNKEGAEDSEEEWEKFSDGEVESARDRGASVNTMVPSDMPRPLLDPRVDKAPTPVPKDTPKNLRKEPAGSDYFQGPSSSNTPAANYNDHSLHQTPNQLPHLSTNLQSQKPEYESDRLRREIANELAPDTASELDTAESISPYPTSSKYSNSAGPSSSLQSGATPRNYWNDESRETDTRSSLGGETREPEPVQPHEDPAIVGNAPASGGPPRAPPGEQTPWAPVESSEPNQPPFEKPQTLPHRFSWEGPLEELGPAPVSDTVPPVTTISGPQLPTSDFLKSTVYPENHATEPQVAQETNPTKRRSDSSTVAETSTLGLNNSVKSREGHREIVVDSHDTDAAIDEANSRAMQEAADEKELPSYPDEGPEVAHFSSEKQFLETSPTDRGLEQQQTPSPTAFEKPNPQLSSTSTPPTIRTGEAPLPPTPSGAQPNMPTFRSLLALKTPAERIRAYDSTREQFANLNTGLANWLYVTTNDLPEHSDLLYSHGRILRAVPGPKTSPTNPSSSNQPTYAPGYSPGGGAKISGKEVQAKSKELLHSAGVIGGKGMLAGKGLFSKGKNKLRGASGTDKALKSANSSSSPSQAVRTPQENVKNIPLASQARKSSRSRPLSPEHQPHPSEGESERNTPSEQSFSKGQMGDDERSSGDYQTAESGSEEAGPLPPRSSSLFIGDKNGITRQTMPRSLATVGEARSQSHPTTNAGFRNDTQSPRSTNSSNKTPTQLSFDHSKAMPTPLERTESPQDIRSIVDSQAHGNPSSDVHSQPLAAQGSHHADQQGGISAYSAISLTTGQEPHAAEGSVHNHLEYGGAPFAERPHHLRTTDLILPKPNLSPLMGENDPSFSLSPDYGRGFHDRGLSFGSVPSAIDPERPPSPVSPFVPPKDGHFEEQRGRTVVPKHHGIDHDFIDESSVERARRRSDSFSRPFQTGRTSEDARPFSRPDLQDHPAFRDNREYGGAAEPDDFHNTHASGERSPASRERAPEYISSGQGAPDLPPVDAQSRSRRASRTSAYFKAIRDSVSPSRRSRTRERSQPRERARPPYADSPVAANSPQSAIRSSNPDEIEEKPRRSSIFGRLKTNNSSHSDQHKEHSATRASTMPVQTRNLTSAIDQAPTQGDSPASNKIQNVGLFGQKLQRSSTTANQPKSEPGAGQKKRFSSIGSLFGRNPKRQSSDQYASKPPSQIQPSGKYTGRPNRPAQRFALDEEDESPSQQSPSRNEPSHPATPQSQAQSQRELPAYVQDPPGLASPNPAAQPPAANPTQQRRPHTNKSPPPRPKDFVSSPPLTYESRPTQRSWMEGTTAPPRNFPNPYPTHDENTRPSRTGDSPPPPPPPKDERWLKSSPQNITTSSSRHGRTASIPLQPSRSPAAINRQSLPPLQTNVQKSHHPPPSQQPYTTGDPSSSTNPTYTMQPHQNTPSNRSSAPDNANLTPEEKRRSRQEQIEKGHLTPTSATPTATPVPTSAQRGGGTMQAVKEDEDVGEGSEPAGVVASGREKTQQQQEEEPIVMSATGFPGDMWTPDFGGWEGE